MYRLRKNFLKVTSYPKRLLRIIISNLRAVKALSEQSIGKFFFYILYSIFGYCVGYLLSLVYVVELWEIETSSVKLSHFVEGIEYHLRRNNKKISRRKQIIFVYWPLEYPNEFLGKRYEKCVTILRSRYWQFCFKHFKGGASTRVVFYPRVANRTNLDELKIFDEGSSSLTLGASDVDAGIKLEKEIFGSSNIEFVIFAFTSRRYREEVDVKLHPEDNLFDKIQDTSDYAESIRNLKSQGFGVVRQGLFLEENPRLTQVGLVVPQGIESKPGFSDVWLSSRCKFLVCSHTGAYFFAEAFNKPWVMTDAHTFACPNWSSRGTVIFCLCWNEEEKQFGSFKWMKDNPRWCYDSKRVGSVWKIVHNTPGQIADVVSEKIARLAGDWVDSPEDDDLQKRFQRFVFGEVKDFSFLPRAGSKFLREHQHLLPD